MQSFSLRGHIVLASMTLHRACRNLDVGNSDMILSEFEINVAAPQMTVNQTTTRQEDASTTPLTTAGPAERTRSPCAVNATEEGDEAALAKTSTTTTDTNEDAQTSVGTNDNTRRVLPDEQKNAESTPEAGDNWIKFAINQTSQEKTV